MAEHDSSYKLLFSHPEMIADLLRGFVREDWVEQAHLSTLEQVSGSYVSDDLRDREDDIIWRVRWGEDWLYVYLLSERSELPSSRRLPSSERSELPSSRRLPSSERSELPSSGAAAHCGRCEPC